MGRHTMVLDENISTRVASTLKARNRKAMTAAELGLKGLGDDDVIAQVSTRVAEPVLVTSDDSMPADHAAALAAARLTVAVVDPDPGVGYNDSQWRWEVIHRWAHLIAEQEPGSVRRYGYQSVPWTDRKGRHRRPAKAAP